MGRSLTRLKKINVEKKICGEIKTVYSLTFEEMISVMIKYPEGLHSKKNTKTYRVLNRTLFALTEHPDNLLTIYLEGL